MLTSDVAHLLGNLHHLKQLGFDLLLGLSEQIYQVLGLLGVGGGEEGVCRSCPLGTGCAANTMHIVLSVVGKVKVDDILNVCHIYSQNRSSMESDTINTLV